MFGRCFAISDNLQCGLNKEHLLSKTWAKVLPPIQENFAVTRDVLLKFLINPLKPEIQDIHNRTQRRLSEPKSIQQEYDESLKITLEHKYYCGLRLLEQFNDKYLRSWASTKVSQQNEYCVYLSEAKLLHDAKRKEYLFDKIKIIIDKLYTTPSEKQLGKKVLTNLKEVAIQFTNSRTDPLNASAADKLDESLEQLLAFIKREDRILFEKDASDTVIKDIFYLNNTVTEESSLVKFQLSHLVKFKPK